MTSTTKNDLPQPTTDLNLAKAHLDEFGYCLLANALTPKQVEALRTRLVEQAAAEKQQGLAFEDGGAKKSGGVNQRVWMLINKGKIFHGAVAPQGCPRTDRTRSRRALPVVVLYRQYRQAGRRGDESAH